MTSPYRIHAVDGAANAKTLEALHVLCLPLDDLPDFHEGSWWLATLKGEPVAFAGMRPAFSEPDAAYLSRCGVLAGHRGHGLQRRLLYARLAAAKRQGFKTVITTTYCNPHSSNNLIRCGFRMYEPASPWGATGTNYWRRSV